MERRLASFPESDFFGFIAADVENDPTVGYNSLITQALPNENERIHPMSQERNSPRRRSRLPVFLLILLNMILCAALIAVLVVNRREMERTVTAMQTTIDQQEAQLAIEAIPLADCQDKVARYNPSTEFIQSFFDDRIVYKDATGVVYAPIDEALPKNFYQWENLTRVNGRLEYHVNGRQTGKVGIDVSKHQGEIDWERVKADGIDFAMLRLAYRGYGTGKLLLDECFEENIQGATDAGMDIGVYVYSKAITVEEALEEAQLVIDSLEGYSLAYPVVIDVEEDPDPADRIAGLSVREYTDIVVAFCDAIRAEGYEPMIYANTRWFVAKLDLSRLTGYKKWLAQYYQQPFFPYALDMWQYSASGKVDGINGNVDLNVWFPDTADLPASAPPAGEAE